jgi:hypothetical protein
MVFSLQVSQRKLLHAFLVCSIHARHLAHVILLDLINLITFGEAMLN